MEVVVLEEQAGDLVASIVVAEITVLVPEPAAPGTSLQP